MQLKSIQDILPWVEQPSRYLGSEINRIRKDHDQVQLKFLLAFPDLYEIGTSHFGIQILYHLINRDQRMLAERVFAPGLDMAERMRSNHLPLASLESQTPAKKFDIIGFSLLYELNYTNVLAMLDLAGIPFKASDRDDDLPLVIAGGPCTVNPEPVAELFDAMVIGDGEIAIPAIADAWIKWQKGGSRDKLLLLKILSTVEGVYVPSFYQTTYDDKDFQRISVDSSAPEHTPRRVIRTIAPALTTSDFPNSPVVPFGRPVHDRLRLEIARGCTRGCRFCQAGMIYRPVRERTMADLLDLTRKSMMATGYEDLSLLSLSTGDYGCIEPLMQQLMSAFESSHTAVSFPSLRAGTMSPTLMKLVKKVRKTGFTIAAEAGSQRLRDVVNKNIHDSDLLKTVEDAFQLGWRVIKLYFMIGLPTETNDDLEEMVDLVKEISKIATQKGKRGTINVSVNTFIPKAHTPFQWAEQISLAESRERLAWLRDRLRFGKVNYKPQQPENSLLEGLWARGDRRLVNLLQSAYQLGCQFDGWGDRFRYDLWQKALDSSGTDIDFFTTRTRDTGEPLPWDHIDVRVTHDFLASEWKKAVTGEQTEDCRRGDCSACGSCDFKEIKPIVFEPYSKAGTEKQETPPLSPDQFETVRICYEKMQNSRFFGHLELVSIFLRAIRRAGIDVLYSQGFHPMPKASFNDPLPVGMESMEESFSIRVLKPADVAEIKDQLNQQLPDGVYIHRCIKESKRKKGNANRRELYHVTLYGKPFRKEQLVQFKSAEKVIFRRKNKKGKVSEIDLKEIVTSMDIHDGYQLAMEFCLPTGKTVRPADVLASVFNLSDEEIKGARIVKSPI